MEIGKAPVEADYTTFASWKQARNAWDSQRRALQRSKANRQKQDAAALQAASDLEAARQWYGSEAARLAINTSGYHGLYKPPLGPPLRTQPYKRLGRPCKQPLEAVVLGGSVCSKSRSGWPTELRSLTHSPGGTRYPSVVFGHNLPAFESEDFDEVRSRRASNIKREARALKRLRSFKVAVDAAATQLTGQPARDFLHMAEQGLFAFLDEREVIGEEPTTVRVQTRMLVLSSEYLAVLNERHATSPPCKPAARPPSQITFNLSGLDMSLPQPFPALVENEDLICEPAATLVASRAAVIHFIASDPKHAALVMKKHSPRRVPDFTAELLRSDVVELECNFRGLTNSFGMHSFLNSACESSATLSCKSLGESADCSSVSSERDEEEDEEEDAPLPELSHEDKCAARDLKFGFAAGQSLREVRDREALRASCRADKFPRPSEDCEVYEKWRRFYERSEESGGCRIPPPTL